MSRGGWARYALERYAMLRRWRDLASIIARACLEVLGNECLEVHVVGGAAEDRLTVLSDIDIVIVTGNPDTKTLDTILAVKRKAEELGLPVEAPIDLKILTPEEFRELLEKGVFRKTEKIEVA